MPYLQKMSQHGFLISHSWDWVICFNIINVGVMNLQSQSMSYESPTKISFFKTWCMQPRCLSNSVLMTSFSSWLDKINFVVINFKTHLNRVKMNSSWFLNLISMLLLRFSVWRHLFKINWMESNYLFSIFNSLNLF